MPNKEEYLGSLKSFIEDKNIEGIKGILVAAESVGFRIDLNAKYYRSKDNNGISYSPIELAMYHGEKIAVAMREFSTELRVRKTGNFFGLSDKENKLFSKKEIFTETYKIAKEGSFGVMSLSWITNRLKSYFKEKENDLVLNKIIDAFDKTLLCISDKDELVKLIINRIKNGVPTVIPTGWKGHSVTIAVCKVANGETKLIYCNRGQGMIQVNDEKHGLCSMKFNADLLNPTEQENLEKLISKLIKNNNNIGAENQQEFKQILDKITKQPANIEPLGQGAFNAQKQGNCGLANKKPILYGLLRLLSPATISNEQILDLYKNWTKYLRTSEIDDLIKEAQTTKEVKQHDALVAKEMLLAIMIKLIDKLIPDNISLTSLQNMYKQGIYKEFPAKQNHKRFLDILIYLESKLPNDLQQDLRKKLPPEIKQRLDFINEQQLKRFESINQQQSRNSLDSIATEFAAINKQQSQSNIVNNLNLVEKAIDNIEQLQSRLLQLNLQQNNNFKNKIEREIDSLTLNLSDILNNKYVPKAGEIHEIITKINKLHIDINKLETPKTTQLSAIIGNKTNNRRSK